MANDRHQAQKQRKNQARAVRQAQKRRELATKAIVIVVVIAFVLGGVSFLALAGGGDSAGNKANTSTTAAGTFPCPAADGSSPRTIEFSNGPSNCIDAAKKYTAAFETSEGNFTVGLDTTKTPSTTNNFVFLSRYHYYDGTKIFRTDTSIDILQGGSPHTEDASDPGPGYTIADEGQGFTYTEGDLVMARGSEANSAGAQFFFAAGPKVSQLDQQGTYVTFGKTTEGIDIVRKILALNVDNPTSGLGGAPSRPVTINKVVVTEA